MKLDVAIMSQSLREAETLAQAAEAVGFDTLWTSETQHDPFLPLGVAALRTQRIGLGTAIAVAFARNPTSVAHLAWDLQAASEGRFRLGLGTQVQAHIERRFGMPWGPPAARLREFILALRAVWDAWQTGGRLNFRGEYYKLTLMAPFFNPGPLAQPLIPVYIAAVKAHMCELAGELCQGLHVHPFHTTRYLREQIVPHVQTGLDKAGRRRGDVALSSSVFVITGQSAAEIAHAGAQSGRVLCIYPHLQQSHGLTRLERDPRAPEQSGGTATLGRHACANQRRHAGAVRSGRSPRRNPLSGQTALCGPAGARDLLSALRSCAASHVAPVGRGV